MKADGDVGGPRRLKGWGWVDRKGGRAGWIGREGETRSRKTVGCVQGEGLPQLGFRQRWCPVDGKDLAAEGSTSW